MLGKFLPVAGEGVVAGPVVSSFSNTEKLYKKRSEKNSRLEIIARWVLPY